MRGIIFSCILVLSMFAFSFAANYTDNYVITTYYPAPYGVYRNMRLNPSNVPTTGVGAGVMYYNLGDNKIKYYNSTSWVNLTDSSCMLIIYEYGIAPHVTECPDSYFTLTTGANSTGQMLCCKCLNKS